MILGSSLNNVIGTGSVSKPYRPRLLIVEPLSLPLITVCSCSAESETDKQHTSHTKTNNHHYYEHYCSPSVSDTVP